jgi:hypothetical protein
MVSEIAAGDEVAPTRASGRPAGARAPAPRRARERARLTPVDHFPVPTGRFPGRRWRRGRRLGRRAERGEGCAVQPQARSRRLEGPSRAAVSERDAGSSQPAWTFPPDARRPLGGSPAHLVRARYKTRRQIGGVPGRRPLCRRFDSCSCGLRPSGERRDEAGEEVESNLLFHLDSFHKGFMRLPRPKPCIGLLCRGQVRDASVIRNSAEIHLRLPTPPGIPCSWLTRHRSAVNSSLERGMGGRCSWRGAGRRRRTGRAANTHLATDLTRNASLRRRV